MSTSSYSLIQNLLEFQNTFINLVHSEILAFIQVQQKKQALLKFQILRMGDKNESFNEMVLTLKKELIEQKQQADPVLKSYFSKILDLDFLPFLHINRYELTKLSIFGFDIYIDPLEAILQILNRLERTFYILEESLKDHSQKYLKVGQKGSWQILLSGWSNYYIYLNFYKLSLNIYMLKEYIQIAGTSLFKKDKEIVFTGVYNFYKKLVPRLIQMEQVQFLQELADLNNTMYSFHGSFDYFLFYTCLKPEKKFIKVYDRLKDLERKCKTTNILTPLLFGILNNFKEFSGFINQVQSPEYVHLLRVLLSGLVINFKLRILEYDQVLELIGATISKLNLLKGMKFQIISGDLGKEWRQAKDFFISAFKSGYSVGQIQTWNLCEAEKIQPKIRNYLTLGTLLLENCKYDDFIKGLQKTEIEELLSSQISDLTSGSETLSSLTNNWKKIVISQTQAVDSKCLNIIRIVNLMNVLQNFSQKLLYAVCSAMIEIRCDNSLLHQVLAESSQTINSMITVINRKESISNLKYILPEFHKRYTPKNTFQDIVPVYLHCFIIKEALGNLLDIIGSIEKEKVSAYVRQILTSLIQKYCPKPQNTFQTLNNFQAEYKVPFEIVHIDSQINSVFTNLTKTITTSATNTLEISCEMLINLLRYCPWYVMSVMNLPSSIGERIQSFLSWLVKSGNKKCGLLLNKMLDLIHQFSQQKESGNLKQCLYECIDSSVLDTILIVLGERTNDQKWYEKSSNVEQIINLVELFVQIEGKFINVDASKDSHILHEQSFQKIWLNLLQLLSCILRNCDFSLSKISITCKLYWKILKRIRGASINEWYQKMLFNLIFSALSSESLSSYETFKGILLISSSKNYMTSKESQGQNNQLQKSSSSERYNFSQIKQFLEANYISFESQSHTQLIAVEQFSQFYELAESSVKNQAPIKISSIHLTNDKQSVPTLSQTTLAQIYAAYCDQERTDKQLQKFCLNLLKLNISNHKVLWNLAKNNEKSQFLSQLKFTRETVGEIFEVMQKIQKITPQQNDQKQILLTMLNLELLSHNVNELQLLSSSFYFEAGKIQTFLNKRQLLWFLIVCNNSNWRQFNEVFSNYLKNQNFMSTLLQYKEFITITNKSSKDYEQKIDQFAQILQKYLFYIQKKIEFVYLLKTSDSQQENNIRKSTLLLNVKLTLLKCEFERIVERMVMVGNLLNQNSLENSNFKNIISAIHSLNSSCIYLAEGNIQLPSFSYHNGYLTENCESKQFMLGRWLENIQKVFGDEDRPKYQPKKEMFVVKSTEGEFLADQIEDSQNVMLRVLEQKIDEESSSQSYKNLKEKLKDYLQSQGENIQVAHKQQIQLSSAVLSQFYQFGHLLYFEHTKSNQNLEENLQKVSPLLQHFIRRQILPLELVKEVDTSSYHNLKLVLMDEKIVEKSKTNKQAQEQSLTKQSIEEQKSSQKVSIQEIFFVWREKQLIEGGKTIKVCESNKRQYVDLVSEKVLGKSYLRLNKALSVGYMNAIFINGK